MTPPAARPRAGAPAARVPAAGRTVIAALLVLLAAGCTGGAAGGGVAADSPAPPAATQAPASEPAGDDGPGDGDPHDGLTCDEDTRAGIDAAIDGQLRALEAGDYEGALDFSSAAYRDQTTPEVFRRLIEGDYALLADDATHTLGTCVAVDGGAQVLVVVEGGSGGEQELLYAMVEEGGTWRIAVAGLAGRPGDAPLPA